MGEPQMKSRTVLTSTLILVSTLVLTVALIASPPVRAQQTAAPAAGNCAPKGGMSFVCGVVNVEDFLPVENGRWLIAGSLQPASAGLYLIDTAAKTFKAVALSVAAKPDPRYPCAAPDLKGLATHGLDVIPGHGGMATVYAINHAGRDSVEVFHLDAAKGAAEWVGCVVMPSGANPNSVAAVPGGGFVVTKFLDNADKEAFPHILAGQVNGVVYLWTPGKGFSEVPGTQLSGDNGIVVSPDSKWLFVNAYGTHEIYRVPLPGHGNDKGERSSVKVDFNPDNLRWAPGGKIFVTGQFIVDAQHIYEPLGWATVLLDPRTMKTTPVVKEPGFKEFSGATSAVQVGSTLWFGTFRGDRVAYLPAP
jgi:hypothetical protein